MIHISSNLKCTLNTESGRFYDWKYGKIFYTKQGKGSPILLIHDLNPASSSFEWNKVIKLLSNKYTVYTLDLLGCGRSDKPNLTYTNYLYVQLITDFIKKIICEKVNVVSYKDSISFTIMACNMFQDCFKKILLINPENLLDLCKIPGKQKNIVKFLIDLPILGTLIYNIIFSKKAIKNVFLKDTYNNHLLSDQTINTYYESSHKKNCRGKYLFSSKIAHYTNINITHAIKKLNNSIYILYSKENENMKNIVESYKYYNFSIETIEIEKSKYIPQLEIPDILYKNIILFIES
jgi:hypothetical protein